MGCAHRVSVHIASLYLRVHLSVAQGEHALQLASAALKGASATLMIGKSPDVENEDEGKSEGLRNCLFGHGPRIGEHAF